MSDELTVKELKELVFKQQEMLKQMEMRVNEAVWIADEAEMYTRQDCLILRGTKKMPLTSRLTLGVPLRSEAIRLLWEHTEVKLDPWMVNTVHWLSFGKSIIVRFNNKEAKSLIYAKRVPKVESKRGTLIIHECLTKTRSKLVEFLGTLKKENLLHSYWTMNGQVFMKRKVSTPPILVSPSWTKEMIRKRLSGQPESYTGAVVSGGTESVDGGGQNKKSENVNSQTVAQPASYDNALPQAAGVMCSDSHGSTELGVMPPQLDMHAQAASPLTGQIVEKEDKSSEPWSKASKPQSFEGDKDGKETGDGSDSESTTSSEFSPQDQQTQTRMTRSSQHSNEIKNNKEKNGGKDEQNRYQMLQMIEDLELLPQEDQDSTNETPKSKSQRINKSGSAKKKRRKHKK